MHWAAAATAASTNILTSAIGALLVKSDHNNASADHLQQATSADNKVIKCILIHFLLFLNFKLSLKMLVDDDNAKHIFVFVYIVDFHASCIIFQ